MIWFTSDLHFGHASVIRFCNRPFQNVEEMDHELIRRWNARVKPDDTVYVLGDVSFHKPRVGVPLIKRLLGHKILVQGNHDKYSATQYLEAGFGVIAREMLVTLLGRSFRLSHYPYWPENEVDATNLRYEERRPLRKEGEILLCGHVHEKWKTNGNQINVGVDQWAFAPVSLREIEALLPSLSSPSKSLGSPSL